MGHIGDRIDLGLLAAVAETGSSLLLIGPRHPRFDASALDGLLARDNVQWVGPKEFGALPGYLGSVDVGLVPYNHSAFNEGSFPLKALEYLGAGPPRRRHRPARGSLARLARHRDRGRAGAVRAGRPEGAEGTRWQRGEKAAPGFRPAAHLGGPGGGILAGRVGAAYGAGTDATPRGQPRAADRLSAHSPPFP